MRLLRPDLLVTPTDDPPGCSVKDERSGQVYEFGAVERFLLAQLRRPYRTEAVAKACNAKFGLEYTRGDIEEFVRLLDGWGMLNGEGVEAMPEGENWEEMEDEITDPSSAAIEESELRRPNGWHLFNPQALLDGLLSRTTRSGFCYGWSRWFLPWVPLPCCIIGAISPPTCRGHGLILGFSVEQYWLFAPFGLRTRLRADSSRGALVLPPPVLG